MRSETLALFAGKSVAGKADAEVCQSLEDEMLYAVTGDRGKDFEREVEGPRLAPV